jgi:hypothetical protein
MKLASRLILITGLYVGIGSAALSLGETSNTLSTPDTQVEVMDAQEAPPTNITDWGGCDEDEVTAVITQDPLNGMEGSDKQYCVARDDLRLKDND